MGQVKMECDFTIGTWLGQPETKFNQAQMTKQDRMKTWCCMIWKDT